MLITLDEFCARNNRTKGRVEDFRAFVEAKGMEPRQTSTTWRILWNEFTKGK